MQFAGLQSTVALILLSCFGAHTLADGGDDWTEAVDLSGQFPAVFTGDTTDNTDQADQACPSAGVGARDEWYKYTPIQDEAWYLDLCGSTYDTKIYVLDEDLTPIGCNDDSPSCDSPDRSALFVTLSALKTYFIVVDGHDEASWGQYELSVYYEDCDVTCPPEGIEEGEPPCGDQYQDQYNGGCDSKPPVFLPINCGDVICGQGGTFTPRSSQAASAIALGSRSKEQEIYGNRSSSRILWRSDRSGTTSIWAMDPDGGNKIQLTDDLGNDGAPCISPDGTSITFSSDRNGIPYKLFLMNSDGSNVHQIAEVDNLDVQFSSWSSDGQRIIFNAVAGASQGGLFIVDRDGGNLEQLTSGYDARPFFEPDDCSIVFDSRTTSSSYSHQLHRLDCDGFIEQCTLADYPSEATVTNCGGVSPDGSRIVYSRGHSIWVADATCPISNEVLLFEGDWGEEIFWEIPSWSPDGEWIVFMHTPAGGDANIYISRPDGSALTQLTFDPGSDDIARWGVSDGVAPDGSRDTDWYQFEIEDGFFNISCQGIAEFPLELRIIHAGDQSCDPDSYTVIASTKAGPCTQETLDIPQMPAGTYWAWAASWQSSELWACPLDYTVTLTCTESDPDWPCSLDCPPQAYPEAEPTCFPGYVDSHNGGCNSEPPAFSHINCGDTICGTSGTYAYYEFGEEHTLRDTDWFEFNMPYAGNINWTGTAEFPLLLFCIDPVSGDCTDFDILDSAYGSPCESVSVGAAAVDAGEYWVLAMPADWDWYPCGVEYYVNLTCEVQAPCDECAAQSIPEGEPQCHTGYVDESNPGCDSSEPWFSQISIGDTICGYTGTYWSSGILTPDSDWYEFTIDVDDEIVLTVTAESAVESFILDSGSGDCSDYTIIASGTADACETAEVSASVGPGTYWLKVTPASPMGVPCDTLYNATLEGGDDCPGDANHDGTVDTSDILAVLAEWGLIGGPADVTGDGVVDLLDLLAVLSSWGPCVYPPMDTTIFWRSNRSGSHSIWAMRPDGTDKRQLTDDLGEDVAVSISPDGSEIAFASDRNGNPYTLFAMNTDGTDLREIAAVPSLDVAFSAWTPDGQRIIFTALKGASEGGMYIVDRDGDNFQQLTVGYDHRPFVEPDGQSISFDRRTSSLSYSGQMFRLDSAGYVEQCTFADYPSELTTTCNGGISPDGSKVVYSRGHSIWVADATCPVSNPVLLFEGTYLSKMYENPSWSPDGEWIVFTHWTSDGNENIYICRPDGSLLQQLTFDPGGDEAARWGVSLRRGRSREGEDR